MVLAGTPRVPVFCLKGYVDHSQAAFSNCAIFLATRLRRPR
jgi:hypothetical protein